MKKTLLSTVAILGTLSFASAQNRYLSEVFTNVTVETDVEFGTNIYFFPFQGSPIPPGPPPYTPTAGALRMDVYQPQGDQEQARPLIVYIHTGNFLPRYQNQGVSGAKDDRTVVDFANKLAKRGFVVAVPNYRLGWNPLEANQVARIGGLLNAVYRANHDVMSTVRYFKKDADTDNNYKIDTNRIILFGQGSGGYVALTNVTLDKQSETELPQFLNPLTGTSVVDPSLVGDVNGVGGQVNIENNIEYSRKVNFCINLGGALGDIKWLEQGDVPMVSFHHLRDQFAPYDSGTVIVPTTNEPVVDVHGSRTVIAKANVLGNQTFKNRVFSDAASVRAYSLNPKATHEGLFEIRKPTLANGREDSSPWEWWIDSEALAGAQAVFIPADQAQQIVNNANAGNPDMSQAKANAWMDTILTYAIPRVVVALGLPGEELFPTVGVSEINKLKNNIEIFPNPATEVINVSLKGEGVITRIDLIDINGRVVKSLSGLNTNLVTFNRDNLKAGNYFMQITSGDLTVTEKVILK